MKKTTILVLIVTSLMMVLAGCVSEEDKVVIDKQADKFVNAHS